MYDMLSALPMLQNIHSDIDEDQTILADIFTSNQKASGKPVLLQLALREDLSQDVTTRHTPLPRISQFPVPSSQVMFKFDNG